MHKFMSFLLICMIIWGNASTIAKAAAAPVTEELGETLMEENTLEADGDTAKDDIEEKLFQDIESEMADQFLVNYTNNITRAQFCYLLVSQLAEIKGTSIADMYDKLTEQQKKAFKDIHDNDVYIALAKKFEIIIGVGNDEFDANSELMREEAAAMLANLTRITAEDHWSPDKPYYADKVVEDRPEISAWASDDVLFILDIGLMSVDKNNNFDPVGSISVENAVLLISKLHSYIETPIEAEEESFFLKLLKNKIFMTAVLIIIVVPTAVILIKRRNRRKELSLAANDRIREDELNQALRNSDILTGNPGANIQLAPPPDTDEAEEENTFNEDRTISVLHYKRKMEKKKMIQLAEKNELGTIPYVFNTEHIIKIGRYKSGNDINVRNETVSGYHCEIYATENTICVRDLGSSNKTIVLRKKKKLVAEMQGIQLSSGDILCLGSTQFEVTLFES